MQKNYLSLIILSHFLFIPDMKASSAQEFNRYFFPYLEEKFEQTYPNSQRTMSSISAVTSMIDQLKDIEKLPFIKADLLTDPQLKIFAKSIDFKYKDFDYWIALILRANKQDLFPEFIEEARARGQQDQASGLAQYNLGHLFMREIGIERDEREAYKWYKKSSYQGLKQAKSTLGLIDKFSLTDRRDQIDSIEYMLNYLKDEKNKYRYDEVKSFLGTKLEKAFVSSEEIKSISSNYSIKFHGLKKQIQESFDFFKIQEELNQTTLSQKELLKPIFGLIEVRNSQISLTQKEIAISYLNSLNQELKDFTKECLKVIQAFARSDFMMDGLKLGNDELRQECKKSYKIKAYEHKEITYLSFTIFGISLDNINNSDQLMVILNPEQTSWPKANQQLQDLEQRLLQHYQTQLDVYKISKDHSLFQNSMAEDHKKKISYFNSLISTLNKQEESDQDLLMKHLFEARKHQDRASHIMLRQKEPKAAETEINFFQQMIEKSKFKIELYQKTAQISQQMEDLLSDSAHRNYHFFEDHPGWDEFKQKK
ncbi:MAG: hypothetical protein ACRYGR_03855 [Janthinobacterium lividum]